MRVSPLQVYILGLLVGILDRWLVSALTVRSTRDTFSRWCSGKHGEFLSHPYDCTRFLRCSHERAYVFQCPVKLRWNHALKTCDWEQKTKCVYDSLDDQGITVEAGRKSAVKRDTSQQNRSSNKSKEPEPETTATSDSSVTLYKLKETLRTTLQPKEEKLLSKSPCTPKIKTSNLTSSVDGSQTSTKSNITAAVFSEPSNDNNDTIAELITGQQREKLLTAEASTDDTSEVVNKTDNYFSARESFLNSTIEKNVTAMLTHKHSSNSNANLTEPITEILRNNLTEPITEIPRNNREVTTSKANLPSREYLTETKTNIAEDSENTPTYVVKDKELLIGAAEDLTELVVDVNTATEESTIDTFMYDNSDNSAGSLISNKTAADMLTELRQDLAELPTHVSNITEEANVSATYVKDHVIDTLGPSGALIDMFTEVTATPANVSRTTVDVIEETENTSKYATEKLTKIPTDVNNLTENSTEEANVSATYIKDHVTDTLGPSATLNDMSTEVEVFTEIPKNVNKDKDYTELPIHVISLTEKSIEEADDSSTAEAVEDTTEILIDVSCITVESTEETDDFSPYVKDDVTVTLDPSRTITEMLTQVTKRFTEIPSHGKIVTEKSTEEAAVNSIYDEGDVTITFDTARTTIEILTDNTEVFTEVPTDVSRTTEKSTRETENISVYATKELTEMPTDVSSIKESSTENTSTDIKDDVTVTLNHFRTTTADITDATKDSTELLTTVKSTTEKSTVETENTSVNATEDLKEILTYVSSTAKKSTEETNNTSTYIQENVAVTLAPSTAITEMLSVNITEKLTEEANDTLRHATQGFTEILTDLNSITEGSTEETDRSSSYMKEDVTVRLTSFTATTEILPRNIDDFTESPTHVSSLTEKLAEKAKDTFRHGFTEILTDVNSITERSTEDADNSYIFYRTITEISAGITQGLTEVPADVSSLTEKTAEKIDDSSLHIIEDVTETLVPYNTITMLAGVTEMLAGVTEAKVPADVSSLTEKSIVEDDHIPTNVRDDVKIIKTTDNIDLTESTINVISTYKDLTETATETTITVNTGTEMLTDDAKDLTDIFTYVTDDSKESSSVYYTTTTSPDVTECLTEIPTANSLAVKQLTSATDGSSSTIPDLTEAATETTINTGTEMLTTDAKDLTNICTYVTEDSTESSSVYYRTTKSPDVTEDLTTIPTANSTAVEQPTSAMDDTSNTNQYFTEVATETTIAVNTGTEVLTADAEDLTDTSTFITGNTAEWSPVSTMSPEVRKDLTKIPINNSTNQEFAEAAAETTHGLTAEDASTFNAHESTKSPIVYINTATDMLTDVAVDLTETTFIANKSKTDLNLATTTVSYVPVVNANSNANNIKDPNIKDGKMLTKFTNKPSYMLTNAVTIKDFKDVEQTGILNNKPSTVEPPREYQITTNDKNSNTYTLSSSTMLPSLDDISSTLDPRLPYRAPQCQGDDNRRQFQALKCYQYYQCFAGWAFLLNCEDGYLFVATDGKCLADTKLECKE